MELDFAMLAENVDSGTRNNLHIFGGGFNKLMVPEVPCDIAPLHLIARFSGDRGDNRRYKVEIKITNPEGEETRLLEWNDLQVSQDQINVEQVFAVTIAKMALKLKHEGKYKFLVMLEENVVKEIPLFVEVVQVQK